MTENNIEITSPIQLAKKDIREVFSDNENILKSMKYMDEVFENIDTSEYHLPPLKHFFYIFKDNTYLVTKRKNGVKIRLVANFIVTSVKECTLIYNNKSGKNSLKYYLATLKNSDGKIEQDVKIANNSKSDFRQFQADINGFYNNFTINMNETEFKSFISEYISPNVSSNVTLYTNAGLVEYGYLLYKNALATPDGIKWADENGYIDVGNNNYVKVEDDSHNLPLLYNGQKTGQEVAKELLENLKECWSDNIAIPMLTLGHMVMSIFYNEFIKRYGAPTLILYGETGTGKSTLVTVGLAIFGLTKDAMASGGSTAKSNEFFCSKYNCLNVCIDDVKAETLLSSNFVALIKGIYKGIPRTRMTSHGQQVEYIHTCSPLTYSTNEALPELREVINRLNVIEIFGKVFKADKFKYHEFDNNNGNNLKELSLILPELMKYPLVNVFTLYEKLFNLLERNIEDTQKRIIHNIAYAYTGAIILQIIANTELVDLQDKVIEYAKTQVAKYENIQTPVDKVLSAITTLYELKQLELGTHFRIFKSKDNPDEYHVRFKKDVVLSVINKYYSHDKSNCVNESSFNSYAKNHSRFRGNIIVRYNNDNPNGEMSVSFNITDLPNYQEFIGGNTL